MAINSVRAASVAGFSKGGYRAIGGTVSDINGFRYHVFTTSGIFLPNGIKQVQALVVGGGGGGARGTYGGGGGGAGGVHNYVSVSVEGLTSCPVTVGTAGAGSTVYASNISGTNGGDSIFVANTTLIGGGGGRGAADANQSTAIAGTYKGCGGGVSLGGQLPAGSGGGTTNAGGTGASGPSYGGGGGYSAVGGNGSGNSVGGTGATGLSIDTATLLLPAFSGMTVIASGGGGGCEISPGTIGQGGTGAGRGANGDAGVPTSATSYGSGGGGGTNINGSSNPAGSGYQGIIVIKYPLI